MVKSIPIEVYLKPSMSSKGSLSLTLLTNYHGFIW
jgi:hypothetical protein